MTNTDWTYRGIAVGRSTPSGYWTALVNLPGYTGYLKSDTKQGMRDLINGYRF